MYKKENLHLPITQGLGQVLAVAVKDGSRCLEPQLPGLLAALHPLACAEGGPGPDEKAGVFLKNANELLRCFEIIGLEFSDVLCSFLLSRLDIQKTKSPQVRAGTLNILRHLVTRIDEKLVDKKELILSGIRPLIDNETTLEVRKVLAQIIISMASQNYLHLEGGQRLVQFIIKQSSITNEEIKQFDERAKKAKLTPELTPGKLRNMCDNILNLATTTIPSMEPVLWPFLFEFLVSPQYTEAVPILCKCLAHLATTKRESNAPDYIIDFSREVNIPKPPQMLVRLMVMLNEPLGRGDIGTKILNCLQSIGPIIHPRVAPMWDSAMPKLCSYIENNANSETWDGSTWEDLTLRLLSETIKIVDDEEWTQCLGEELSQQLEFYRTTPNLKKAALKQMGLILQKMNRKEFIKNKLDMLFTVV